MKSVCVLALAIAIIAVVEGKKTQCEDITKKPNIQDCTIQEGGIFFMINGSFTWAQANRECAKVSPNAHLATLEDLDDYAVMLTFVDTVFNGKLWLGASDTKTEGSWVNVDDSAPMKYQQWLPGRPNTARGNSDDCLAGISLAQKDPTAKNLATAPAEIYTGYIDTSCSEKGVALCEIDV